MTPIIITNESKLYNAVNEILRDRHIKTSNTYTINYRDNETIAIISDTEQVLIRRRNKSEEFIFNELRKEFKLSDTSLNNVNLKTDFIGTEFHKEAFEIEKNLELTIRNIKSDVSIIKKVDGKIRQLGFGNIIVENPKLGTIVLFAVCGINQAFTEKQAHAIACESFSSAQGETLLNDETVEQLRNIKKIYETGFIITKRIR